MWRRCSSCKAVIGFEKTYWICSVSTCNRKRTGLVFCSTDCWDAHLGFENHRESWALERRSPTRGAAQAEQQSRVAPPARSAPLRSAPSSAGRSAPVRRVETPRSEPEPRRVVLRPQSEVAAPRPDLPREILIVASKLKHYVRAASGMNTSDAVMDVLSDRLRELCDDAIDSARRHERKTVLDRDFE
jgi:hypothetical protein